MVQVVSISYDLAAPVDCKGRALTFQICLDIYQVVKITILCRLHQNLKYLSWTSFGIRSVSLIVNLCFYYDGVGANQVCSTGFPFTNLIIEKLILISYNLINLGILYRITAAGSTIASITQIFLVKDGLTFVICFVLELIFVIVVALFPSGYIYSVAAALGNGIATFALYMHYTLVSNISGPAKQGEKGQKKSKGATVDKSSVNDD
ncbi:hypothetical protein HDV06_005670 [Boothiomyces sp. JEL0866]|nr:hypothetical protein HDV06_005670 [Boothiomyces sp. JEL0866]